MISLYLHMDIMIFFHQNNFSTSFFLLIFLTLLLFSSSLSSQFFVFLFQPAHPASFTYFNSTFFLSPSPGSSVFYKEHLPYLLAILFFPCPLFPLIYLLIYDIIIQHIFAWFFADIFSKFSFLSIHSFLHISFFVDSIIVLLAMSFFSNFYSSGYFSLVHFVLNINYAFLCCRSIYTVVTYAALFQYK